MWWVQADFWESPFQFKQNHGYWRVKTQFAHFNCVCCCWVTEKPNTYQYHSKCQIQFALLGFFDIRLLKQGWHLLAIWCAEICISSVACYKSMLQSPQAAQDHSTNRTKILFTWHDLQGRFFMFKAQTYVSRRNDMTFHSVHILK